MTSCLSNATAKQLTVARECNLGFLCAHNDALHPPEYCQPTVECQMQRLQLLHNICEEPQGLYEPIVCPEGYYCPEPGHQALVCPAGSFCPVGSYRSWPCEAVAYCPAGSARQYPLTGLLILIIIDLGLSVMSAWPWWAIQFKKITKASKRRKPRHELPSEVEMQPAEQFLCNEAADLAAFVCSVQRCVGSAEFGLSFELRDISLQLPKTGTRLLTDITCSIVSGQLWGVMGASGAGKSTFVNLLIGKLKATTGELSINGVVGSSSSFKKLIGFVPQDDVVLPELTVEENIRHSARVRLPRSWTDRQVDDHVYLLLRCLGLWDIRNHRVGDVVKPLVSGGQRKRVSIGMELAAAPTCLVLDEPTSGLDATSALSIINMLRALTRLGVTVVCIIHQPRAEIFDAIDQLILLSRGFQVYVGPRAGAVPYISRLGFDFPVECNQADIIIDIISGHGEKYLPEQSSARSVSKNITQFADDMILAWKQHHEREAKCGTSAAEEQIPLPLSMTLALLVESTKERHASWLVQFRLCFIRALRQQSRQTLSFFLEIGVAAIAGLLLGLSVFRIGGHLFQGVYLQPFTLLSSAANITLVPQMGLLCSLAIGLAAAAPGVKVFGEEKLMYWREADAGHDRSAYYVGKVASTIFRMALSSLHFTVFYVLLATPLMPFGLLYVANLLYFFCIYGLASCVATVTRREDGPLLAMIVSLIIGVFGGYGPPLSTIKDWHLEWFWRMCPGTWFSEAYFYEHTKQLAYLYDLKQAAQWTGYSISWPALDFVMLLTIGVVYRVVAYFGLVGLQHGGR